MKFIPAKCPNCGAKIKVDINKKIYHCDYCRNDIILDDGTGLNPKVDQNHMLHVNELLAHQKKYSKFIFIPFIIIFVLIFGVVIFGMISTFSNFNSLNDKSDTVDSSSYNVSINDIGVMSSFRVEILLNNVVDNISNHDRNIVVVYDNNNYEDITSIMNLILSIKDLNKDFMVTNEKDSEGFINKIIIVRAN